MGSSYSRIEREETVSRCKFRKRYMKQLVNARQAFSAAHSMYLHSFRSTGSALLQFAIAETNLHLHHHHHHHLPPVLPSPAPQTPLPLPAPMSPSSDTWTSVTASPALPPPPPPPSSTSDYWNPFVPSSSWSATEEDWEVTTTASEAVVTVTGAVSTAAPPSLVSGFSSSSSENSSLVEIMKQLDEYMLKVANTCAQISSLLESIGFSSQSKGNYGGSLWTWGSSSPKLNGYGSHCSTVDRLYAWEKKLYGQVKAAEAIKVEQDKKVTALKKQEMKRVDCMKTDKTKKEVEKFELQMRVASQAIEETYLEIIKLRETELYTQHVELVKGLMCMWRSMYECHQVQQHIVQQLKYLNTIPSTEPTSELHRQSTLQLELQVQQWHMSFCNVVKAQRDYIQSLTGWLRLSLFQFCRNPLSRSGQESKIYSLCEEWHLAVDQIPDKVASDGIKSFLTVVHAIVVQQADENKQKKKSESVFKDLEKKMVLLRSLECKYGPSSMPESSGKNPVAEKRLKVDILRVKAEEEKTKHEKSVCVTRAKTLDNLQMGLPHVFEAMVGFSSVCMHAFEAVYNHSKGADQEQKRLLP